MADDEKKRAHTEDGKFKADNPDTPDINEAYQPVKYYLAKISRITICRGK